MLGSSPRLRGTGKRLHTEHAISAVHPRACGERSGGCQLHRNRPGSSPRLRGTGGFERSMIHRFRFIPAPAGNGTRRPNGCHGRTVHPRACGERETQALPHHHAGGSSPRLRGTGSEQHPLTRATAVHPRACGERTVGHYAHHAVFGSSPRLRGTAAQASPPGPTGRFIPAPAGNGIGQHHRRGGGLVHPRACGERDMSRARCVAARGSSPRLRGTGRARL